MEPDHEVEAHRVRLASEHQAACLPGLFDDRLRVVGARLLADPDKHPDPITRQRHRAAYRRERDVLANADTVRLVALLGDENEIKRTAARDELLRREGRDHAERR